MLFTTIMRRIIYSVLVFVIILSSIWMLSNPRDNNNDFSEKVKIALRDAGNQLLLANQDSTSLVLPVIALEQSKYELSFQNKLSLEPDSLVSIIKKSLKKLDLPEHYRVEVIQCLDEEVAYSYEMLYAEEKSIIPCKGRVLPESCYEVEVSFTEKKVSFFSRKRVLYGFLFIASFILLVEFLLHKRKHTALPNESNGKYNRIGSFKFYPEQNKLIKEAIEINLSKKECELLAIFIANPNQIIKRDELTKKVWEDNGVFVGRSLDTYISKLRKKLKADNSIKLTNVHGVGYKLEITNP